MLLEDTGYTVRKKRNLDKKPLWDKDGYITRDISFELQFGFSDTLDLPMYEESAGLDVVSIPKEKPIKF